jgi:enoyl-CoA hydratase/carnithine racemase
LSSFIEVSTSHQGRVATLCFTDEARQNQLCWAAVDQLADNLRGCRLSGARVLILSSGLARHWFEHAWLDDLCAGLEGRPQTGTGTGWFSALEELAHDTIISIAAISGDCAGGGAELAWACDMRISERHARFAQIEINAGLTTGIGGCSRLMRLVGITAVTEMVLTGKALNAPRLFELGAVTELVDSGESVDRAQEIAAGLVQKSPAALAGLKRILRRAEDLPLSEALEFEQKTFRDVLNSDGALQAMKVCQTAYDAGASIAEVHDYD